LPDGTVTFLFTDLEGSTRLLEAHPAAYRDAVRRHHDLLRGAVEASGGAVFETVGDAVYAAFARPTAAVAAALAGQLALQAEPWGVTGPLRARMGVHLGEVEVQGAHYFGAPLYRGARLMATAHGGQVVLTAAVAAVVRDALPAAASLRDLGAHRLRDLAGPERVYQLGHPDLPAEFPPLRSLDAFPHNLPLQLTSFVGRERELATVQGLLAQHRLVTLTGPGGTGKTRLAQQAAAEALAPADGQPAFADGVWLVELAALADPALVPQAVATAVGVREEPGRPVLATLTDALRPRRLLLLLDNCEHLLDAGARLADTLLRACPRLTILATSREALGVAGETAWPVPSLALPDAGDPRDSEHLRAVEALTQCAAVRLFLDRAVAVHPSFRVTPQNAPAVALICARLDGIPLAIELAAARIRVLPPAELLTRLEDRFRLLTGGSRTALERHRTLQAAVDWSYDLLTAPEKLLFDRLSVFAGGWTLASAEAVCAGDGIAGDAVLDLLTRLVDQSLVLVDEQPDGTARYRLLETLRAYAQAHLAAHGAAEALRQRHARVYLALVEAVEARVRSDPVLLDRAEREHDNCRAALRWLLDQGEAEASLRFAAAMGPFWAERGHLTEGRRWLAAALAAGAGVSEVSTGVRAKALGEAAGLAGDQGDAATGRTLATEALALWREVGDRWGIAKTTGTLGWLENLLGDRAAARRHYEQSLALSRRLGYTERIAFALNGLGAFAAREGDAARGRSLLQESLALRRELGLQNLAANTLMNLGNVAFAEDDHVRATRLYEESLALSRALGARSRVATALNLLGEVARSEGDCARAAARYEEALTLNRELGNQRAIAQTLCNLGHARLRQGDRAEAAACFREGLTLSHAYGHPQLEAESLAGCAGVAAVEGHPRRAARLLAVAEVLLRTTGRQLDATDQAEYDRNMAAARIQLDEPTWAFVWAAGQAMSLEQAVADALAGAGDGPP
jgi:predicted ATPase/class 3 adenylate cyclase